MKAKRLEVVSSKEFWACEKEFAAAHEAREGNLELDAQAEHYDHVYDILVRHLRAVGTLVEGFGGADFSTSRYVDPNDVTVVVSDTAIVFRPGTLDATLAAIREAKAPHMVIFDTEGESYIAVLPDGRVIGCSDKEDLHAFDQARNA